MSTGQPDRRLSFDRSPRTYDRARREYPEEAFSDIFRYLRFERPVERPVVVEIGPGTGQATKRLLAHGARITAIEVGPRLAQFMREKFASEENLDVVTAAFEETDLTPGAYDMVFAATSFHWLNPAVRVQRSVDLLAPGGVLATLSTMQVQSEVDRGFFERTVPVYRRYRPDEQLLELPTDDAAKPSDYGELRSSGLLGDVLVRRYRWDQTYSIDAYEQLVRSYSDIQTMDPGAREKLISDLRKVIEREFGGEVTRPLVIGLTLGRRSADGSKRHRAHE